MFQPTSICHYAGSKGKNDPLTPTHQGMTFLKSKEKLNDSLHNEWSEQMAFEGYGIHSFSQEIGRKKVFLAWTLTCSAALTYFRTHPNVIED